MPCDFRGYEDLRAAAFRAERQLQERERHSIRSGKRRKHDYFAPPPPVCMHCLKRHTGECRKLSGACFGCGEQGHLRRDCPQQQGQACAFALTIPETTEDPDAYGGKTFSL